MSGLQVTPVEPPPTRRPTSGELPAWIAEGLDERQQRDCRQLGQWLEKVTIQDLRAMARLRGWTVRGARKAEVVSHVLDQIDDVESLRRDIATLDREHAQVLRALFVLGDDMVRGEDVDRVARMWGPLTRYKQVETYSRHLCQRGLALPESVKSAYSTLHADFVPRALARGFPPLLADVLPTSRDLPGEGVASGLRLADPLALPRAAGQLILLLEQSSLPLRPPMPRPESERRHPWLQGWDYDPAELAQAERAGMLGAGPRRDLALTVPPPSLPFTGPDVARLAPIVGGQEQLDFLYALLLAAQVIQPGNPITVWPEVKTEFLQRDELAQRALLARLYFATADWSELWPVLRDDERLRLKRAGMYAYLKPERLRADLLRFRHRLLRILACLPDDHWVRIADLEPLLQAVWRHFDALAWESYRQPSFRSAWFLARNGQPLNPDDPGDWRVAQSAFVRQAIAGPLHWLGLADLDLDDEELVAFRLHGLAGLYWDRVEAPGASRLAAVQTAPPAAVEAVTAGEQTITVVPSLVSAQAHSLLDQIARLELTEPDRFVYRLDAQAAHQAFEAGAILDDLLAEWEHLLPVPLPAPMAAQLAAWWADYGRLRLYQNLTVIEFGDDYALAEMKAATSLEQFLVAEISPRLVIVRAGAAERLVSELEKAGYTPKQTDEV